MAHYLRCARGVNSAEIGAGNPACKRDGACGVFHVKPGPPSRAEANTCHLRNKARIKHVVGLSVAHGVSARL